MQEITINSLSANPDSFGQTCSKVDLNLSVLATEGGNVNGIITTSSTIINCEANNFTKNLSKGNNTIDIAKKFKFHNGTQGQITVTLTPAGGDVKSMRVNVFNSAINNFITHISSAKSFMMDEIQTFKNEDNKMLLSNRKFVYRFLKDNGFSYNNKLKKWTI